MSAKKKFFWNYELLHNFLSAKCNTYFTNSQLLFYLYFNLALKIFSIQIADESFKLGAADNRVGRNVESPVSQTLPIFCPYLFDSK